MNYRKLLIARHSPENRCFSHEGEILVPAGPEDEMQGGLTKDDHFFVGLETGLPSLYGWVKEVNRFVTAAELARLKDGDQVGEETLESCEIMLRSVTRQQEGTPMGCHYVEIRLPGEERRKLKVHKVIFYQA